MINNNLLSALGFSFKLNRTPNAEYLIQTATVPGISLGSANMQTPLVRVVNPGNLTYEDFAITFKISEDLTSYLEIFNWMTAIGHPDNLEQYKHPIGRTDPTPYKEWRSDASLIILNSAKRPILDVTYTNVYPTSLSTIEFDATLTEVQYITATATFAFDRMYFNPITG